MRVARAISPPSSPAESSSRSPSPSLEDEQDQELPRDGPNEKRQRLDYLDDESED